MLVYQRVAAQSWRVTELQPLDIREDGWVTPPWSLVYVQWSVWTFELRWWFQKVSTLEVYPMVVVWWSAGIQMLGDYPSFEGIKISQWIFVGFEPKIWRTGASIYIYNHLWLAVYTTCITIIYKCKYNYRNIFFVFIFLYAPGIQSLGSGAIVIPTPYHCFFFRKFKHAL